MIKSLSLPMADKRIDIVELKLNNFPRWRNDLQVALIFAKCSAAVEHEARPGDIDEDDWLKMCNNATAIILRALRDDYWRVAATDSPFQVIRKIEDAFQPTSSLITILNICRFFALSQGVSTGEDIVKEVTSLYAELRRSIQASDALRNLITIDASVRTAILAFALEKTDPIASQQIKERFERGAATFEQAVSLLAELRMCNRSTLTGTPTVAVAVAKRDPCPFCKGRHALSKCWFNDPSLAPERLKGKICTKCKTVGHSPDECKGKKSSSCNMSDQEQYCFGIRHNVFTATKSPGDVPPVILDSGCTIHMMTTRDIFSTYTPGCPASLSSVYTASGQPLPVVGHGSVTFRIENVRLKKNHDLSISNVLHVPDLKECILSVSTLDKKGIEFTTGNGKMILRYQGKFLASAPLDPDIQQYCLSYLH